MGHRFGGVASVLSSIVFNYLFVSPRYALRVDDPWDTVGTAAFLATAVIVGRLAVRLRRAAQESARLSTEQIALRRIATLVAQSRPPLAVFEAVTREVGLLCGADLARMEHYEEDGTDRHRRLEQSAGPTRSWDEILTCRSEHRPRGSGDRGSGTGCEFHR